MKTTLPTLKERSSDSSGASNERSTSFLPDEGDLMLAAAILELPQEVVLARMLSGILSLERDRAATEATAVLVS